MNLLKAVARRVYLLALVAGWWLAVEGVALAKKAEAAKKESSGSGAWVFPYTIVILSIGLGMLVVCRSSRRSERSKPEGYQAIKTAD